MAEITAGAVKEPREKTGAGMMDCKKALSESGGDFGKAEEYLRTKGLASAAKKAGRTATEGAVGSYIHMGGKIGVLVEVNSETDFVARTEAFQALVKDVAMHIAAAAPQWVRREEVPADVVAKEREIAKAQMREQKKPEAIIEKIAQGKPANVQDKIAEGKLKEYYATFCLLEQPFVKEPKLTVGQLIQVRMSNIEQKISNDEVKSLFLSPSAFDIRYSIFFSSLWNFFATCREVTK